MDTDKVHFALGKVLSGYPSYSVSIDYSRSVECILLYGQLVKNSPLKGLEKSFTAEKGGVSQTIQS